MVDERLSADRILGKLHFLAIAPGISGTFEFCRDLGKQNAGTEPEAACCRRLVLRIDGLMGSVPGDPWRSPVWIFARQKHEVGQ